MVWDSALDRRELGETIASRFDGAVTYYNQPKNARVSNRAREQFKSTAVLDWATLHPVERLELLTTHDLARQEKQKLELLRHLLTYYHYAAAESREDVLRAEINRVRNAADSMRDRLRGEAQPQAGAQAAQPAAQAPTTDRVSAQPERFTAPREIPRGAPAAPSREAPRENGTDFDEAHTQIINGRHRRNFA
jgi:hypothetical protein